MDEPVDQQGDAVITALRAELQQRAAAEAHARGELADLRSQLSAREAAQAQFTAVREDLRAELNRLLELIAQQDDRRAEVESRAMVLASELTESQQQVKELAAARDAALREREKVSAELAGLRAELVTRTASQEAAMAEADTLRGELDRLGAELSTARERVGMENTGVEEAQQLLEQARELTAVLRDR